MTAIVLRLGAKGDAVRELQQLLAEHGFWVGVDGDFGPRTEGGVRAFQRSRDLDDDGVVGPLAMSELRKPAVIAAPVSPSSSPWVDGWWRYAKRTPAHPGRIGGPITPFATVVHSCDMLHDELPALIHAWTGKAGNGACAHFVIGPSEVDGTSQFVPINRNGNHAGGDGHGVFVDANGRSYHPNLVAIGIEIHCAGGVRLVAGQWRLVEDGKARGTALKLDEVIADPQRVGRGWQKVTPYQYDQLGRLLDDLELVLAPMPLGLVARSIEATPLWGQMPSGRVVGHTTLDTEHRSDPWPPTMQWLRDRAARP